jgi:hypothetical protein
LLEIFCNRQELDALDSRLRLLAHTGFHAESAVFGQMSMPMSAVLADAR